MLSLGNKKAFTLIELMLVVIIISILSAMVLPRLVGCSKQARIAAALADIFLTPRIAYGENGKFTKEIKRKREKTKQIQQTQRLISERLKEIKEKSEAEKETIVWNEHMRPSDYYRLIWQRINERIIANKPERPIAGEVLVSFAVTSDGKLAKKRAISVLPDTDPALVQIALDSVERAAPFPPFPSTIEKQGESFNIKISYE
ncbi:MAG: prepilin-type N-terminal cleavage/methylation domain-containing protein [Candidatus Omnitrophota bacterium]|nr:MAG: prepilin-type N-terminal cleavage/methylation domain-containing protein [Candidatus Omnitrophota bacterium]